MSQKSNPLLDAIDKLTQPHTVTNKLDDGSNHYESHEGLIKQLRDAIASNIGGSAGGKSPRERIPLDADALIKYEQIETAIDARYADLLETIPGLYPEDNLRAWYVRFENLHRSRQLSEDAYDDETSTMESWVRVIEEKLSPPTIRELDNSECPECGFAWYDVVLNAHKDPDPKKCWYDKERSVALTVTYRPDDKGGLTASFAKCGCCGHVWMGSMGIRALAYQLEKPADELQDMEKTA